MITRLVSVSGYEVPGNFLEGAREFVYDMEEAIKMAPQIEVEVEHIFAYGLYTRVIRIPKGIAFTGRIHRQDDLQILVSGDLVILNEDGTRTRYTGHAIFRSQAGVKPLAVALEETVWATVHHTHLTDLAEIEKELFFEEDHLFDFETGRVKQEEIPCRR
jgi:hypothetical protein